MTRALFRRTKENRERSVGFSLHFPLIYWILFNAAARNVGFSLHFPLIYWSPRLMKMASCWVLSTLPTDILDHDLRPTLTVLSSLYTSH